MYFTTWVEETYHSKEKFSHLEGENIDKCHILPLMAFSFASYIVYVYLILYLLSFASRDFVDTSWLNFIKYDSLMDF